MELKTKREEGTLSSSESKLNLNARLKYVPKFYKQVAIIDGKCYSVYDGTTEYVLGIFPFLLTLTQLANQDQQHYLIYT